MTRKFGGFDKGGKVISRETIHLSTMIQLSSIVHSPENAFGLTVFNLLLGQNQ